MDSCWLGRLLARPKFPADGLLVVVTHILDDDCFLYKARFSDGIDVVMGLIDDLLLPCNGKTIAVTCTGVARIGAPIFTARGLRGRTLKTNPPGVAQSTAAEDELVISSQRSARQWRRSPLSTTPFLHPGICHRGRRRRQGTR
jgi:hypothetical protein